jgi:hypothetical protein
MPSAIAFVFGVLLFLSSAAALALEAHSGVAIWRLPIFVLALLHTAAGFLAMGGGLADAQHRKGAVAACATVSGGVSAIAACVAFLLAARYRIAFSWSEAIMVVIATLLAGIASVALMIGRTRGVSAKTDRSSSS